MISVGPEALYRFGIEFNTEARPFGKLDFAAGRIKHQWLTDQICHEFMRRENRFSHTAVAHCAKEMQAGRNCYR